MVCKRKIVSPLLEEFFYKRGYDERATTAISVDEVFDAVMAQLESAAPPAARQCRLQDERSLQQRRDPSSEDRRQRSAIGRSSKLPQSPAQLRQLRHRSSTPRVALLTGGGDKPYALGMAAALTSVGISVDFIGSDDLNVPELLGNPRVNFLNLRGDQRPDASPIAKVLRVLRYYVRLISYAATAKPKLFHILWNNKFQLFDRTLLMLYYKLLGKKIVLTAHNVNAGKRDSNDSWLNRLSLKIQYNVEQSHLCSYRWDETRTYRGLSYSRRQGERYSVWD